MKSLRVRLHHPSSLVLLALAFAIAGAGPCEPTVDLVRGPYLQRGSDSAVVVRWRTSVASDGEVRYGLDPSNLFAVASGAGGVTDHEVALTGLSPDTTYYYSVGTGDEVLAGGNSEHAFLTAPVPGTAKPTRVWVLGDSGTADANAAAVRDAYAAYAGIRHTDLWIMLGDNAYTFGTDGDYQKAVFDMYPSFLRRSVLWATLGNHDGYSASSATQSGPYYDAFTFPTAGEVGGVASGTEAYYSFDYANVHFVNLESNETDRSPGGAMLTWLAADLADNDQEWLVAFWHHPPYTKGSHDSDSENQLIEMRENALPLLEAHGVDLVLSGHSHSYERSYLIDGHHDVSSTFGPSMVLDGGDGRVGGDGAYDKAGGGPVPNQGAVYAVAGSSGKTSSGSLDHPAMFVSLQQLGSMVLDVEGDTLDAVFLTGSGAIGDSFRIAKAP